VFARCRKKLTFANVMSTLALFLALGGTAYAAGIGSADVADNSLKSIDLKDGKGVAGVDVVNDSLTGADIRESKLGKVANANKLDGLDSSAFARIGTGPWHAATVNDGAGGTACSWTNAFAGYSEAGYLRDRAGVIHLRGIVKATDGTGSACSANDVDETIFTLPAGFRPDATTIFPIVAANKAARVDVAANGTVQIEPNFPTWSDAKSWVSLDGLSFRCAPAGSNGCP
jgi:hypothetical protein